MHNFANNLTKANVGEQIEQYTRCIEEIGNPVADKSGVRLLWSIKRDRVNLGPYPDVSLFEAANRIMTDSVIFYGVRWLLVEEVFPFETYRVEFGNEDESRFDICAEQDGKSLVGEAFNVAPSFFQGKKTQMLKKLREQGANADFKIIMVNHDAASDTYKPKPKPSEYFVFVQTGSSTATIVPHRGR